MANKKRRGQPTGRKPADSEITLDLGRHEAPIAGFADGCSIVESEDSFEVLFFEARHRAEPIVVGRFFMTYVDLATVWGHTKDFYDRLQILADRPVWPHYEVLSEVPAQIKLTTTAPLCSVMSIAKISDSALIECYYLTATSRFRLTLGRGNLKVVPLFAVQLPAGLIASFVTKLKDVTESHPPHESQRPPK